MKPLIIANWKCNPTTVTEAKRLSNSVKKRVKDIKNVEVVICPPFVYLPTFNLQSSTLKLGSQDCFWEEKGAFTGEISALMLKDIGCQYVIVGHSERRRCFSETDDIINKKLKAAIKAKLIPVLCIGETGEQRDKGEIMNALKYQLAAALKNVSGSMFHVSRLIIAYEPVWAIGTGTACPADKAQERLSLVRKIISQRYSPKLGQKIKLIYGGSVDSANASQYLKKPDINGLLVGGASLNAQGFFKIIQSVTE